MALSFLPDLLLAKQYCQRLDPGAELCDARSHTHNACVHSARHQRMSTSIPYVCANCADFVFP